MFNTGVERPLPEVLMENRALGEVEAMPTKPFVPINNVEVPTALFVPLKYANCPVVPDKLPAQIPLAEVQSSYPFIVEVADIVRDANEAPSVTDKAEVVAVVNIAFEAAKLPSDVPP